MPIDESSSINKNSTEFTILTNQGDKLVFNLDTGKRIQRSSPRFLFSIIPVLVVPICICLLIRRQVRLHRIKKQANNKSFQYSIKNLLEIIFVCSISLTLLKYFGWFGGICIGLALLGAGLSSIRNPYTGTRFLGAITGLYSAYIAVLLFAIIDDQLVNIFGITPLWWAIDWWLLGVPIIFIVAITVIGVCSFRRLYSRILCDVI